MTLAPPSIDRLEVRSRSGSPGPWKSIGSQIASGSGAPADGERATATQMA